MIPPLLPPDHPDAPKYWMNETSGVLAAVVQKYLHHQALDRREVGIMRHYLRQWVESPVWSSSGRTLELVRLQVSVIACTQDIDAALSALETLGMDPL